MRTFGLCLKEHLGSRFFESEQLSRTFKSYEIFHNHLTFTTVFVDFPFDGVPRDFNTERIKYQMIGIFCLFVATVVCVSFCCEIVHSLGANLHLEGKSNWVYESPMKRLIAIGLKALNIILYATISFWNIVIHGNNNAIQDFLIWVNLLVDEICWTKTVSQGFKEIYQMLINAIAVQHQIVGIHSVLFDYDSKSDVITHPLNGVFAFVKILDGLYFC